MAKDRKKLQHMHSSIPDKQPTPASLEVGEIAVNNAAEQEFLSVKNTDNKVVRFSSDGQIIEWIERKEVMPYKGYVRGEGGPTTTSGDTPTSDDKGSYGVTNKNLLENKSQLVFKLNQVAADLTTKHDKVNGADDMFGEEINPTDDYGVNDGAGFFIDMSRYAMIDANPSFSALTATCQTTLSGNTFIRDGASANTYGTDTGHTLDIKVTDTVVSGVTWDETLSAKTENISGRTTTIGNDGENLHVIGKTIEVHDDDVTITNKSDVTENTSGITKIDRVDDVFVNNQADVTVVTSGNSTTTISGNTVENHSGTTVENHSGTTTINNTGKTTVNVVHGTEINSCEGISANTNNFIIKQCQGATGDAEFEFCDGFNVKSNDVEITQCTDGSITITERIVGINAENTTINDSGNTVINTTGNSSANTTGNVVVNTTGTTTIDRNGNVSENNHHNVTVVTSGNNTTTISGNAITNVSGNTTADTGGNVVVMTSGTTTETKGGNVTENNQSNKTENTTGNVIVNTTGTTTETKGGVVTENNLSDKTENTTGDHSLYVTGNTCITSQKTARFYGNVSTEIGVACDGTPASATSVIGTDTLKMSGTTTTLSANSTTITSCGDVTINTNELKVKQCGNAGSAQFDFCNKFAVNSSDVDITQCGDNGSITITEETVEINAGDTTINDSGDTTINTTGDTTLITSGSTTIKTEDGTTIQTTNGDTNINTTGDTNITSTDDICAVADKTAAFVGTVKTNIGKNCADGGQTKVLNINGDTINITGGTMSAYTSGKTCVVANTDLNLGGNTNTRIGSDCAGNPFSDNVYVSATTLTEVKSPTITLSGNTTNITGATNVNIKGNDICISGGTEASMGANAVKVGTNCDGTTIATGISAFSTNNVTITSQTINESGTTEVNIYGGNNVNINSKDVCVVGTNEASIGGKDVKIGTNCDGTTIATGISAFSTNNVTVTSSTINITGTSNTNVYGGDVCISGGSEASMGAQTVNVGTNCGGSMIATTINISGTTINEGGTTNNNNFTTINNTATTINNNTTNYNITGTTNIEGDTNITGDTYIGGNLDVTENVHITGDTYIDGTLHLTQGIEKKLYFQTGTTDVSQSPYDGHEDRTITIPSCVSHLNRAKLNYEYGVDVTSKSNGTYDPGENCSDSASDTISIPTCVSHIKRAKLDWAYVTDKASMVAKTYDPGANCTNSSIADKVNIPKSIKCMDEYGSCFSIDIPLCVTGTITASGAIYSSDRNLKENINYISSEKFAAAMGIPLRSFNFKDDENKRLTYGVIAQEVQEAGLKELVHVKEDGTLGVDYTSLLILKIKALEDINSTLKRMLVELEERVTKLEGKDE